VFVVRFLWGDFVKSNIKVIFLSSIILLSIPLLVHFLIAQFIDVKLEYKDFFSIYGSYVGGLIGVLGALYILSIQINNEKRKEEIKEINNYLKCSLIILKSLDDLIILLNDGDRENGKESLINIMHNHLNSESNYKSNPESNVTDLSSITESLLRLNDSKEDIAEIKTSIENLNEDYIPLEVYKEYKELITILNEVIKYINDFLENDFDVRFLGSNGNAKKQAIQYRLVNNYQFVEPVYNLKVKFQAFNDQKIIDKNNLK
jgi:hypothetical protein